MKSFAAIILTIATSCTLNAKCGFDFNPPTYHFEGISNDGYVYFSKEILTPRTQGQPLKIYIEFGTSPFERTSSIIGNNWYIPIFEAYIEQVSETEWIAHRPDGLREIFKALAPQGKSDKITIKSSTGWRGTVSKKTITISSECGSTLEYTDGKITKAKHKDGILSWTRSTTNCDISLNGAKLATLSIKNKNEITLKANTGEAITISHLKNEPAGEHAITCSGATSKIDAKINNENGTLSSTDMQIEWSQKNGHVTRVNNQKVAVHKIGQGTKITCTDPMLFSDSFFLDKEAGIEEQESQARNLFIHTETFTSGILNRAIKRRIIRDWVGETDFTYHYDEKSTLLHIKDSYNQIITTGGNYPNPPDEKITIHYAPTSAHLIHKKTTEFNQQISSSIDKNAPHEIVTTLERALKFYNNKCFDPSSFINMCNNTVAQIENLKTSKTGKANLVKIIASLKEVAAKSMSTIERKPVVQLP